MSSVGLSASSAASSLMDKVLDFPEKNKPKMVIFDCDFTIWPYWADYHLEPPWKKTKDGNIVDKCGEDIKLYDDIPKIIQFLNHHNIPMAIASKSPETKSYKHLMELFDIKKYFVQFEIYYNSKDHHMRAISNGQNVDFNDMVFFDDEPDNIKTTSKIGVTAIHCPNNKGVTFDLFTQALKKHDAKINGNYRNVNANKIKR